MRALPVLGRALGVCAALGLAAMFVLVAVVSFPSQDGVDFYHFWGIAAARKAEALDVSPYRDPPRYAQVLNSIAESARGGKLRRVNLQRRDLEPTATPFLYAAFAILPRDYETAQSWYVAFSYAAGLLGVFTLARLRGFGPRASVCLAFLIALTFNPFTLDVTVTNVNLVQLGVCAALLCAAAPRSAPPRFAIEWIALAVALVFVVFKPNAALVMGAYVLQRFLVLERKAFMRAAWPALAAAIAAVAVGAYYFGSAFVWTEWWAYASRLAGYDPINAIARGNQSLAMALAQRAGFAHPGIVGVLLALVLVVALLATVRNDSPRLAGVRHAFADPMFGMSFAVLLTFAASPLVWIHYMVLALIPIVWLLRGQGRLATVAALLAWWGMARPTAHLFESLGVQSYYLTVGTFAWLALIPGMLAAARSAASSDGLDRAATT